VADPSIPARASTRVLRLPSFAKVNLGLEVLGLRDDGYHELRTLFQTIDLHDDVVLRPRPRGVVVRCDHPLVPTDGTNLAARAAEALRAHGRVRRGVEIEIRKRIPVGGGLGGGSSNAAAVLLGLDRLWKLGLGPDGLHRWPAAWGRTCPTSCSGAPPWVSPGGTRSTPCGGRSGPTWWSWTPGCTSRPPACSPGWTLD
jgi:4-diphosphocytidyl-2-C-methyl-D-erythritol kinase